MAKKQAKKPKTIWWWVEAKESDSFGILRWKPHYNVEGEPEAKRCIKVLTAMANEEGAAPTEYRYTEPGHDRRPERKAQDKAAAKGVCPRCGASPKKTKKGRNRGFEAFKCLKCGWIWRLAGTRDPAWTPTRLSKPSEGSVSGKVAGKKGKKAQKGKEKKGKKGKRG